MQPMIAYYTCIIMMTLFASALMLFCVKNSILLEHRRKRALLSYFSVLIVSALCEWSGILLQGAAHGRILHILVKMTELTIAPSLGFLMGTVIWPGTRQVRNGVYAFILINMLLEVFSAYFGFIYYVGPDNVYVHGPWYILYIFAYAASLVYCVVCTVLGIRRYRKNGAMFMIPLSLMLILGVGLQIYNSEWRVCWPTLAMAGILYYVFNNDVIQQTDPLTLLLNRRGYENSIAMLREPAVILFFDVDRFKTVNDTYGHAAGDRCLSAVGRALRTVYGQQAKCFRIGGDEFCVILDGDTEVSPSELNSRFFAELTAYRRTDPCLPNVSVGYCYFDPTDGPIEDAIAEADRMMYMYKSAHCPAEEE